MRKATIYPFFILLGAIAIGLAVLLFFVEIDAEGDEVTMEEAVEKTDNVPEDTLEKPDESRSILEPETETESPINPAASLEAPREILAALIAGELEGEPEEVVEPEPVVPGPYDAWTPADHASERQRARNVARTKLEAILDED
jgi:hypothetical protein